MTISLPSKLLSQQVTQSCINPLRVMIRFHEFRKDQQTRDRHSEVDLHVRDLIYPYFVTGGTRQRQKINTLDGIERLSIDELLVDIGVTLSLGIDKILLFGVI